MARTPLRRSERLRRHSSPLSPPPSPPLPPPQTRTPPRGSPFQSHAKPCSPHTDAFPDLRRLCPGDRDVFDVVDIEIDIMDLYQAAVAREVDEPDSDLEEAEEDEDEGQDEAGRSRIAGERDSSPSPSVQSRTPLDGFAFRQIGQHAHRPAAAGSSSSTQLTKAERRKRAQERAWANTAILKFKMRPHVIRKYTKIMQFKCTIAARDLPHTKTAWLGREALPDGAPASLRKIRWDGRKPLVLVDRNGYIMCAMHGRPDDPTWDEACGRVCLKLVDLGQRFYFNETDSKHRRGEYPCFHAGVSYGGGQKGPMNRKQASKGKQTEVDRLLVDNDVIRLAGHGSASFATTAPKLFKKFDDTLNALCERDSKLKCPYPNSVWAATTFNLGGQVITTPHTDHRNLASGWCSITALGNFDPQAGGHLVLHSLGLIIEFPPNSECCILSACIVHSNTPVQPGEVRCSITQYSAGGLFRWVASGFRKLGDLAVHDPQRKVEMEAADPTRWDTHILLLSKVKDLAADVSNVFGVEMEVDDGSGSV